MSVSCALCLAVFRGWLRYVCLYAAAFICANCTYLHYAMLYAYGQLLTTPHLQLTYCTRNICTSVWSYDNARGFQPHAFVPCSPRQHVVIDHCMYVRIPYSSRKDLSAFDLHDDSPIKKDSTKMTHTAPSGNHSTGLNKLHKRESMQAHPFVCTFCVYGHTLE